MGYFSSLDVSASALTAQRLRMDVISQNIANANSTRTENGQPYRRKIALFQEREAAQSFSDELGKALSGEKIGNGVRVSEIIEDQSDYKRVYDPAHPDADEKGYVRMPNVDVITEMVNMISSNRAYEANITAVNTTKNIAAKALEIGR
jgi:flagellar basal-body rod protein FlgC